MEMEEKSELRIPRPRGCTILAKTGQYEELESRVMEAYFSGSFPYGGMGMTIFDFSQLYSIPLQTLKKRVKDGALESVMEDGEMVDILEKERSRSLASALSRIGTSDAHLGHLIRHLVPRVLQDPRSHPLLVKEFNAAIGNQIRLTETQLKTVLLLNDILKYAPIPIQEAQEVITRDEVLERIGQLGKVPIPALPEGAPDLRPIQEVGMKQIPQYNREASHEFQALKDQEIPIRVESIPVLPR